MPRRGAAVRDARCVTIRRRTGRRALLLRSHHARDAAETDCEHTRRVFLYRFAPATSAYGRAAIPDWPAEMTEGLTPAEAAVLEPPYHPGLDRPTLTLGGGGGVTQSRVPENTTRVFGSRYFESK